MCVFFCTFAENFNCTMAFSRTYYRVAEHLFAVECSDSALLSCMTNYEPFAVEINNNLIQQHCAAIKSTPKSHELFRGPRTPCRDKDMECEKHSTPIFTLSVEMEEAKGEVHPINSRSLSGTPQRQEVRGEEWTHVLTDNAEEDMPRIEVYRSSLEDGAVRLQDASLQFRGGEWLFRVAMVANAPICCEMECSEDFTQGVLHIVADCQDVRFCIDNALMLLFAFRTAPLMTLEMHAAVVVRPSLEDGAVRLQDASLSAPQKSADFSGTPLQDALTGYREEAKGYLFLGHSGTGKSTHARQWLAAFDDAWLLNDDNPILRVMEDGEVRVYGSPWSGKTPCYNNAYARVGGIIKLSQAPHNKMRILSLPEAYAYMLSSASGLKMDRQMADYMYESIKHVITHVKCYHLDCLPNTEAAEVAQRGMV